MFTTLFYNPLYNLLVVLLGATPHGDIGIAIILLTILVKIVLYPLNKSSTITQYKMKKVEKELKTLKEKTKDKAELALKTMEIYRRENIKPFSSILTVFLQIPVFISLYLIFSKGIVSSPAHLYSFVTFPREVSSLAFGFLDVSKKYIYIGVVTAISYFVLARIQTKSMKQKDEDKESFSYQFNDMLKKQMLYVFPIITGVTAAAFPAAIGVYWITSNLFSIGQMYLINKHILKQN